MSISHLGNLVAEGIRTVLGLYAIEHVADHECTAPERTRLIMASIGFGGDHVRGAMTIVAARTFWSSYATSVGMPVDLPDALLSDMAGEFANMVMGRMRNGLLRDDVTVHQATPTCAFGEEIAFRDPGVAETRWRRFTVSSGELFVRLDVSLDAGFVVPSKPLQSITPCSDELQFF